MEDNMSKKHLAIIALFLIVWTSGVVIAQEDEWYESDGTKNVDLIYDTKTLNSIFPLKDQQGYANFWIVGDSGLVVLYKGYTDGTYPDPLSLSRVSSSEHILNPNHNLMSISFAGRDTGWIVGYVNGGTDHWKGVIWKTTDGGIIWNQQTPPELPLNTPFLKVQAISGRKIWISCGNGYVLKTINGGIDWYVRKPGGESNFNWFYGLYAFNENNAFVASDQTGLVSRTLNGTDWDKYYPLDTSLVYFDIHPGTTIDRVYLAASKAKMVGTEDGCTSWFSWSPDPRVDSCQWWTACTKQGSYNGKPDLIAGTSTARKWPKLGYIIHKPRVQFPYDFKDIGYIKDNWDNEWCVAVGNPRFNPASGHSYRNIRYWYEWNDDPPFKIQYVKATSGLLSVTIELKVKNYTDVANSTIINIWQSPSKGGPYINIFDITSPVIQPNQTQTWTIVHTPPDSLKYWYGASLDCEHMVELSPEVDSAKAINLSSYTRPGKPENLVISDVLNDHGRAIQLNWTGPGPSYLTFQELSDDEIWLAGHWRSAEDFRGTLRYVSCVPPCTAYTLTGTNTNFWVQTYDGHTTSLEVTNSSGTPTDNAKPPDVTGITYTIPNPYTIILKWDPVPREAEWNLAGYEVKMEKYGCPEDQLRQQKAPIISTMRAFRIHPLMIGYPGFWYVRVVDRSGNTSPWSDALEVSIPKNIYIPGPYGSYSTALTQGRHLVRALNSKDIYITFDDEGKIYLSLTTDEGENWGTEEIDEGLYPCVGLNYRGLPWIAYTKDGDLVCKIKRDDGSWKEILIFDGDEGHWAGPPSMHLATMPIKEDVIDYA